MMEEERSRNSVNGEDESHKKRNEERSNYTGRSRHRSRSPRRESSHIHDKESKHKKHLREGSPEIKQRAADDDLSPLRHRQPYQSGGRRRDRDDRRPEREEGGSHKRERNVDKRPYRGERRQRNEREGGKRRRMDEREGGERRRRDEREGGERRSYEQEADDRGREDVGVGRVRWQMEEREGAEREGQKNNFRREHREHRQRDSEEVNASQYEFGGQPSREGGGDANPSEGNEEGSTTHNPDYGLSGKLAAETNTYKGVVINYSEPLEARIPKTRWRLYGFKGDESLPTLYVHRQSAYLVGRDRRVCDMPVDHPSCSKQHAVLQYRLVEYEKPDGSTGKRVRPYLIDLGSTNGTYINNQRIESARYYELKEKDGIKFGFSSREYVILHENSKQEESDEEKT